jgi:hypothetical protein
MCLPLLALAFLPLQLDTLQQGDTVSVTLSGRNLGDTLRVEQAMSQNVGPFDFEAPQVILPKQDFVVRYKLGTAGLAGPFTHTIILVGEGGKPEVATVQGVVAEPILTSQGILDMDYYTEGQAVSWSFYAYARNGKPFDLSLAPGSTEEFSARFEPVKLDTREPDKVSEGGSTPGYKVTLSVKKIKRDPYKSIRRIVSFDSKTYPRATPEVMVTGYWKE